MSEARKLLAQRLVRPPLGRLGARTTLAHFALITYALPPERLRIHVPEERFEIREFTIGGERRALLSVVPFLDLDFRFPRLAPWPRLCFGQTNHRVYVRERSTGEPMVWFLGTTLGSLAVYVPRHLWQLPWHRGRYSFECEWDSERRCYRRYAIDIRSRWCSATIELDDTGAPAGLLEGFSDLDEQILELTHPVRGAYRRRDGRLGTYSIWHPLVKLSVGEARRLHFDLYERLGLLSRSEMERPHSVLLTPAVEFDIHLPPRRVN
jgi:hypothetical protein